MVVIKHVLFVYIAGPWTVFAPTNTAFMNLPMKELEELITNPKKLSKLVMNHIINRQILGASFHLNTSNIRRTIFSAGLRAHQLVAMANGNKLNLFSGDGRKKQLHVFPNIFTSYILSDRLKIEGSNVINMDIPATNGVIQVVESIIEMQATSN